MGAKHVSSAVNTLKYMGITKPLPENCNTHDFYSDILRSCLKIDSIKRGHITCTFLVKPPISVIYSVLFYISIINLFHV